MELTEEQQKVKSICDQVVALLDEMEPLIPQLKEGALSPFIGKLDSLVGNIGELELLAKLASPQIEESALLCP